ncbi:uncharacterized protein L203_104589 [Cryptococcus depauperatus CBS 7841]|uniref:Uncharacterized protein n=1 Tax=Cryptococcus depauperatus CBS 7841 TaxID=1295531 RepID=A0A1E3ILU4_9TREE|nr:hypothetical protein L203_02208 [Cryptococcus depauperatus CBS 7841]
MPSKRSFKRRNEDEKDGRSNKRQGRNRREQTYDTFDAALDGGVEMEEKGERYRDGDKAQRFYERAVELYAKAAQLRETFDAVYNQARTLYNLAAHFLLPPTSLLVLRQSVVLYERASVLTHSPLLRMDVAFNLAQAVSTLADILEDVEDEEVGELRKRARDTLAEVMDGQESFLAVASQATEEEEEGKEVKVEEEAVGDEVRGMEVDRANGEHSSAFETHLPTPSTFIDTVLALVELHLTLWESRPTPHPPTEDEQTAVRAILGRAAAIAPPGRQAELDLAEIDVLLAMDRIVWDTYKSEAKAGSGIEHSLNGAVSALEAVLASLDVVPAEDSTVRHRVLATLADTHMAIASRLMLLNHQLPPGPTALAQDAWDNLSRAITHLNATLNLATDANTLRGTKASILLTLSKASLERAKLATSNETSRRNIEQLLDNAVTYAGRAGETLGWRFLKVVNTPIPSGGTLNISGSSGGNVVPHQAGWEIELLGRTIALQQIRACLFASHTNFLSEDARNKYREGLANVLETLQSIKDSERVLSVQDVERWIANLEDDQGDLDETEKDWWREIMAVL